MTLLSVNRLAIDLTREGRRHRLVHDARLEVSPGQTVAVVGESGSGKSLTALAVMGLLPDELSVTAGHVVYDGREITGLGFDAMRRLRGPEIAMIFQEPMTALNPVRNIGSQLTEGMRLHLGLTRRAARRRAVALLEEVGVADAEGRLSQYPHQFSGGMRQRVMIAIALSCEPRLILADEPTTALDVTIQAQILALTAALCRDHGVGLVLITHNLGIVARHADRVNVMYGGRVVEQAAARELFAAPAHPYTQGLLASVPRLDLPRDRPLQPIAGAPPDPMADVPGCRFHPRCPAASARCARDLPPLERQAGRSQAGRSIACWHPLHAETEAPA